MAGVWGDEDSRPKKEKKKKQTRWILHHIHGNGVKDALAIFLR